MITKFILVIWVPEVVKSVINGDLAVASRRFDGNKLVLNPRNVNVLFFQKITLVICPLALVM